MILQMKMIILLIKETSDGVSIEAAVALTNETQATSSVSDCPPFVENPSTQKESKPEKKSREAGSVGSTFNESSHLVPKKRSTNFVQLMGLQMFRNSCFRTLITAQTVIYIG